MTRIIALAAAAFLASATLGAMSPADARSHAAGPTTTNESAAANQPAMTPDQFASEGDAKAHCGSETIVWVNTRTHVYHFPGTAEYGRTKHGAFMCKADADKSGKLRAAKNQTAPRGMTGTSTMPRR